MAIIPTTIMSDTLMSATAYEKYHPITITIVDYKKSLQHVTQIQMGLILSQC